MRINLSQESEQANTVRRVFIYVACYVVWLAFSGVGFWLLLALRINLIDAAILMRFNPWQVRTVDRFALFGLGIAWFVGILALEYYLRAGVGSGTLWRRTRRIALALGLACAISYGLRWVATL